MQISTGSPAMLILTLIASARGQSVEVTTRYGVLRGSRVQMADGSYVDKYLKIPFARPPVGNLRFRPPEEPERWHGIRDATLAGPECPQPDSSPPFPASPGFPMDEDCLYLNVHTPQVPASGGSLPVMFYLPGGAFYFGTANLYNGTVLANKGVVVVTTNYRLNALGFLSTEDAVSPGNYGLLDQIRALEWVRDNIADFNGDPSDVTVFSESAGSVSVSLLLQSPKAKGLFNKAIMQSGSAVSPHAVGYPHMPPQPRTQAERLASMLDCPTSDSTALVSCLRGKDVMAIINATVAMQRDPTDSIFRPVPEATFGYQEGVLSATPETCLLAACYHNVSTIRGYNKEDWRLPLEDPEDDGISLEEFQTLMHKFVDLWYIGLPSYTVDRTQLPSILLEEYVTKPGITGRKELRAAFIQMVTEVLFMAPSLHELDMLTERLVSPQYLYRFSYRSANRLAPEWTGVLHGDELSYEFGQPLVNDMSYPGFVSAWTEEDKKIAEIVMTLWANFAKYGDPTPQPVDGVTWLPWTHESPTYLDIARPLTVLDNPITARIRRWIDTIYRQRGGDLVGR